MIGTRLIGALVGCLLVLSAAVAQAGVPTEQLKGAIERVVKTLDNPALKGEAKVSERRAAVRKIANDIFDFSEIARRSLGRHWAARSEAEQKEFVALFGDLLERAYISKIDTYGGEKIVYTAERSEGDIAIVSTKIISKGGTEVPVDYRMLRKSERWLVYDVNIEGVSLVANYRKQFNKIIQTSSYAELVKKMKTKQGELLPEDDKQGKPRTQ
jgi:phospholipid transport system substrate-binding protein